MLTVTWEPGPDASFVVDVRLNNTSGLATAFMASAPFQVQDADGVTCDGHTCTTTRRGIIRAVLRVDVAGPVTFTCVDADGVTVDTRTVVLAAEPI